MPVPNVAARNSRPIARGQATAVLTASGIPAPASAARGGKAPAAADDWRPGGRP
jgi:hypothetical protein